MAEITPVTEINELNLTLYRLVMRDTAAAKKAIAFVSGDKLKYELFIDGYALASNEPVVARTDKAIQIATEAMALFIG